MTNDERNALLQKTMAALAEHHETVVITVTFNNPHTKMTDMASVGCGNGYAQRQSLADVIAMANARALKHM